jgi:hypothetical protein
MPVIVPWSVRAKNSAPIYFARFTIAFASPAPSNTDMTLWA